MIWESDPCAVPSKCKRIVRVGRLYYEITWQRIVSEKHDFFKHEKCEKRELVTIRIAFTRWGPWRLPTPDQAKIARERWLEIIHLIDRCKEKE